MFTRKQTGQTSITVDLEESLTSDSCSKLITELIKYILYQKQQIPFSCDTLIQMQTRTKPTDRNFSSTNILLNTLNNITQQLTTQLHLIDCNVKEVLIIIGATTISPKFCLKFELPSEILSSRKHLEYQHSYRKPLLQLMRQVLELNNFFFFIACHFIPLVFIIFFFYYSIQITNRMHGVSRCHDSASGTYKHICITTEE